MSAEPEAALGTDPAARCLHGAPRILLRPLGPETLRVALEAFRPVHRAVSLSWRLGARSGALGGLTRSALAVRPLHDDPTMFDVQAALAHLELQSHQLAVLRAADRPDGRHVAIALSSGRPTIVLKVATSPLARPRLQAEAAFLGDPASQHGLSAVTPRLLAAESDGGWLATAWVEGRPHPGRHLTAAHRSVLRDLAARTDGDTGSYLQESAATATALGSPAAALADALGQAAQGLAGRPLTFAHGDLVPWNLRLCADGRLAALDWETSGYRPPLWDAVHWYTSVAVRWGRRSSAARARRQLRGRAWEALRAVAADQGYDDAELRSAVLAYAADSAVELAVRYGTTDLGQRWGVRLALVEQLLAGRVDLVRSPPP